MIAKQLFCYAKNLGNGFLSVDKSLGNSFSWKEKLAKEPSGFLPTFFSKKLFASLPILPARQNGPIFASAKIGFFEKGCWEKTVMREVE